MNRRQAKKNFKKKYGMNPSQYGKVFAEALKSIDINALMKTFANAFCDAVDKFTRTEERACKSLSEALNKLAEYKEQLEHDQE